MTVVRLNDRPSKYHANRTGGYASKREFQRSGELRLLEKMGKITNLREQPRYQLLPAEGEYHAVYYIADFTYWDVARGCCVVEDCKGFKTQVYRLKKRLLKHLHGIDIWET